MHYFPNNQIFILKSDNIMARKIKITQQQLEEAVNKMKLQEDQATLELQGDPNAPIEQRVQKTQMVARQSGIKDDSYNINIPNEALKENKHIFTKSQLLEARKKFLKENSTSYSKTNFLKKN